MDDQDNKSISGDFKARAHREKRLTDEIGQEKTQVVWRARSRPRRRGRKKSIVPLVAIITMVVAGLAITLGLLLLRSPQPKTPVSNNNEDPLALYQVATELYEQGEYSAALQMLERAREVTTHSRAHRQLDGLKQEIDDALAGRTKPKKVPERKQLSQRAQRALASVRQAQRKEGPSGHKAGTRSAPTRRPRSARRAAGGRAGQSLVYVESDAIGDVLVDGQPTGTRTPATLKLAPGPHTIEVIPLIDPTERMVRSINVERGRSTRLKLALKVRGSPPLSPGSSAAAAAAATADTATGPAGTEAAAGTDEGSPAKGPTSAENDPAKLSPSIGTVGAKKPAIGLVGGSKPTIGIVKGKD